MNSIMLMEEANTRLIIIDMQKRLIEGIHNKDKIINNIRKLIKASHILGIEIIYTEQNPKRLGCTLDNLLLSKEHVIYSKMSFSCVNCEELLNEIYENHQKHIVICGIESHVCVQQTVLELMSKGLVVYLVADAIGSRHLIDNEIAIRRMGNSGAILTTAESTIFEWCKTSSRKEFKEISKIIKEN